jgi:DhnA family fructose-bisphosphate aldolase class Ia
MGWIVNLTGSRKGPDHTDKYLVSTVLGAIKCGCDCVAVHVNITSRTESNMIANLGLIIEEADRYGIPTLAIAYTRKNNPDGTDDNYESLRQRSPDLYAELVSAAVRISADLGASMVKAQYPGNPELLQQVCDANREVPILVAGGPTRTYADVIATVREIASTNAAGIAFGRNTYNRSDPTRFIAECRSILSENDP